MKPLTAYLLDDEPPALRRLMLSLREMGGVEVVGSSTSARVAVAEVAGIQPDILFLDISMPGLDGFEVVEALGKLSPVVIFVTAYDAHAVKAFGIEAVDYLLKPFALDRLVQAVERARAAVQARPRPSARFLSDIWGTRNGQGVRIDVEKLLWVEAERDYLKLHTSETSALIRMTLSTMEAALDPDLFVRVHRSIICRRDSISAFRRKATGALVLTLNNGEEVPVGRSYAKALRQMMRMDEPK